MLVKYLRALLSLFVTKKGSLSTVYGRDLSSFTAPSGNSVTVYESTSDWDYSGVATADGWITLETAGASPDPLRFIRVNSNNNSNNFSSSATCIKDWDKRLVTCMPIRKGQSFRCYCSSGNKTGFRMSVWFTPIQ